MVTRRSHIAPVGRLDSAMPEHRNITGHGACRPTSNCRVRRTLMPRPSTPTLTAADTTYTAGMVGVGIQAGGSAGSFDVDNIVWTTA